MVLSQQVKVARRFQRAVRIDTDLSDPAGLEGFICPRSSADILEIMARHTGQTRQGAFTWTGPYGGGKSSLAVTFSALLNGDSAKREKAAEAVGRETAELVWENLPPGDKGWKVLPVIGEARRPEELIGEAIKAQRFPGITRHRKWSQQRVLDALDKIATTEPEDSGGLLVFIDEMGKILDGSVRHGEDIHFLQNLAEHASRSDGRLLVVGILHQAFEEYAHRTTRETRDEWAKIQGRFVDLSVNAAPEEQIVLIGRAIEKGKAPPGFNLICQETAESIRGLSSPNLPELLEACWPLHPVVACLLGPISRRRFGQNQRSIFGFLSSAEPRGFQEFLSNSDIPKLYRPEHLWDYLRLNLEPSILASPDSHRWNLATEAQDRCSAQNEHEEDLEVLKVIALIDMFKEKSGLAASPRLVQAALPNLAPETVQAAITRLRGTSLIVYRKFNDSYSLFEGSDFGIEDEVARAMSGIEGTDPQRLNSVVDLQPLVAKRHYHETGALRWFNLALVSLEDISHNLHQLRPTNDAAGVFLVPLAHRGAGVESVRDLVEERMDRCPRWVSAIGLAPNNRHLSDLARELLAAQQVRNSASDLAGDPVARRELDTRVAALESIIQNEISETLDTSTWFVPGRGKGIPLNYSELNALASDLADEKFSGSPIINNELLSRDKPSGNAVAAQNTLLRRMAAMEGEVELGIKGHPAEWGIFASVLEKGHLYREVDGEWKFVDPKLNDDPCRLRPLWDDALEYLKENQDRAVTLSEIQDRWHQPPFGVKKGLVPVLSAAFVLANQRELAWYRQGVFQAHITDLDMDYLAKDTGDVSIRWMDLTQRSRELLSEMAGIVRELDQENSVVDLEPIDVARGLVTIFDRLPAWVGRTQQLSANARRVRQLFKQASDPNKLIFDQIPQLLPVESDEELDLDAISSRVGDGLQELQRAYPGLIDRLETVLLTELQVPNRSPSMLEEIRERARNIRNLAGDHRLEAFVMRISEFDGSPEDVENLASMAASKPVQAWVDNDINRAIVEIATMSQKFLRMESVAHVKGRADMRHAVAVTVGIGGRPYTMHKEFDVTSAERPKIEGLMNRLRTVLRNEGNLNPELTLAALAEVSAEYLNVVPHQGQLES